MALSLVEAVAGEIEAARARLLDFVDHLDRLAFAGTWLAALMAATEGLQGAALEAAVDDWVEQTVDRHARAAPEALRDELRAAMRAIVKSDPGVSAVVRGMKRA